MRNNFISIHHVSFIISDLKAAKDFYCKALGLQIDIARPELSFEGLWLIINQDQQIHLLLLNNPDSVTRPEHGGRDRHAAFKVRNFSEAKARLDEHKIPYTVSKSGRQALFCRDPDGNTLELIA
jgi:glyoxylase I family protein